MLPDQSNKPKQPTSFWYSKLDTAASCLYRYKREHIDGIPGDGGLSPYTEFGEVMHLALETMFEGDDASITFRTEWEKRKDLKLEWGRYNWAALKDIGLTCLQKFERLHYPHIKPIMCERRIYGKMGKHDYEGTPDLYGLYRGNSAIMDFKTSSQRYAKEKIVVAKQLGDYARLITQNGLDLPKYRVYFVFVKYSKSIQVLQAPITEEFLKAVEENNRMMIEDLKTRKEFPRNYASCLAYNSRCPHFTHCHGGQDGSED